MHSLLRLYLSVALALTMQRWQPGRSSPARSELSCRERSGNSNRGMLRRSTSHQASIGPGMAVFSRFSKILEADGSPMRVRTALGLINQVLDEVLAEQESEFDPSTRWAIGWFEQYGMSAGPYGVAETLSKAKNTSVAGLVRDGFLEAGRGKVRLLRRDELSAEWDPRTDARLSMWEITQHLIGLHESGGDSAAAELARQVGGSAEAARDLAYRLFTICDRKGRAQEAIPYNALVIAWPEISRLAARGSERQGQML